MAQPISTWPPADAAEPVQEWLQDCDCRRVSSSLLKPPVVQIARLLRQSRDQQAAMKTVSPETRIMQCIDAPEGKACLKRTLQAIHERCDWLLSATTAAADLSQLVVKIKASFERSCQVTKHATIASVTIQCHHLLKDYASAHTVLLAVMALDLVVPATLAQQVRLAYAAHQRQQRTSSPDVPADEPSQQSLLPAITQVDVVAMDEFDPVRFEEDYVRQG